MPSILRSRLALFVLLGAFLIPIGMSSLRGLTHVLACKEQSRRPFTVVVNPVGEPEVLSSSRISRDRPADDRLCGGLTLDIEARTEGEGKVKLILPVTNHTEFLWRGTVTLVIGETAIPVDIGQIGAGGTAVDEVDLDLDPGTLEVNGSLLIGP